MHHSLCLHRYQLNDDVGSKFTIDPLEGRIITSGVLDRETQASYSLTVTVHDGAERQSSTSVYVEVTDVNDSPPHYGTSSYSALLPSTTTQGMYLRTKKYSGNSKLRDMIYNEKNSTAPVKLF